MLASSPVTFMDLSPVEDQLESEFDMVAEDDDKDDKDDIRSKVLLATESMR